MYFDGGGIGLPLAILLAYVVVSGVVLFVFVRLLGRRRSQLWSRSEAYGWVRGGGSRRAGPAQRLADGPGRMVSDLESV